MQVRLELSSSLQLLNVLKIENAYLISRYSSSILILLKKDLLYFDIILIIKFLYNIARM
jgi:hypothetical protein